MHSLCYHKSQPDALASKHGQAVRTIPYATARAHLRQFPQHTKKGAPGGCWGGTAACIGTYPAEQQAAAACGVATARNRWRHMHRAQHTTFTPRSPAQHDPFHDLSPQNPDALNTPPAERRSPWHHTTPAPPAPPPPPLLLPGQLAAPPPEPAPPPLPRVYSQALPSAGPGPAADMAAALIGPDMPMSPGCGRV